MINLEKKTKEVEKIPYVQTQYAIRLSYGQSSIDVINDELKKGATFIKHVQISENNNTFVFQKSEDEIKDLLEDRWRELRKITGKPEYE